LTRRSRQGRETRRLVGLSPSPCPRPRIFIESRHPNEHRLLFASSFKRPPGAGTPPRRRYWHGQTLCVSCPALRIQLGQFLDKQFLRGFSEQGVVIGRIATRLASRHLRRSVTFVSGRATSIPALFGTSSHFSVILRISGSSESALQMHTGESRGYRVGHQSICVFSHRN